MINPVSEQEKNIFQARLSIPSERVDVFPETDEYSHWIEKIGKFIALQGASLAFGIEKYKKDFEFFTANNYEEYSILFISKFSPLELVFFGTDWMIGVSSYPNCEGSDTLEYAIRLYGSAIIIDMRDEFGV